MRTESRPSADRPNLRPNLRHRTLHTCRPVLPANKHLQRPERHRIGRLVVHGELSGEEERTVGDGGGEVGGASSREDRIEARGREGRRTDVTVRTTRRRGLVGRGGGGGGRSGG